MKIAPTRNDKILIGLLVVVALLTAVPVVGALAGQSQGGAAEIVVSGRKVASVSLSTAKTFTVVTRVGRERLQVSNGRIRVLSTPCPRRICARQGWISRSSEEIVCIPGEMIVRVRGGEPARVDAVSR